NKEPIPELSTEALSWKRASNWRNSPRVSDETVSCPKDVDTVCCLSMPSSPATGSLERYCETGPAQEPDPPMVDQLGLSDSLGYRLVGRIDVDHVACRVSKGLKIELRDDEILLLGGKAKLGGNHRVEQNRKLVVVVGGLQQDLNGRSKTHELVKNIQLR